MAVEWIKEAAINYSIWYSSLQDVPTDAVHFDLTHIPELIPIPERRTKNYADFNNGKSIMRKFLSGLQKAIDFDSKEITDFQRVIELDNMVLTLQPEVITSAIDIIIGNPAMQAGARSCFKLKTASKPKLAETAITFMQSVQEALLPPEFNPKI